MRYEIFAAGIILLVIGLLFYLPAHETVEKYNSYGVLSDIGRILSDDLEQDYRQAKNLENIGIILIAISLVIVAGGFLAEKKESQRD